MSLFVTLLVPPHFLHFDLPRVQAIQRTGIEQFTVLHHLFDGVRVSNIGQRTAAHKHEIRHFAGFDAPAIPFHADGLCSIQRGGAQGFERRESTVI
jgi:hypothetical protein